MSDFWYEHNEDLYNLSQVVRISTYGRSIIFHYSGQEDDYWDIDFDDDAEKDSEFERIKTILDKIY